MSMDTKRVRVRADYSDIDRGPVPPPRGRASRSKRAPKPAEIIARRGEVGVVRDDPGGPYVDVYFGDDDTPRRLPRTFIEPE